MLVTVALWAAAPWSAAQAQSASRKPVTVDFKSVSVKDFFAEMKKQTGLPDSRQSVSERPVLISVNN